MGEPLPAAAPTRLSMPIPNASRAEHLAPLLLPQRHLRLPSPRGITSGTLSQEIHDRDQPPSNGHDLQDPSDTRAAPYHSLAGTEQRTRRNTSEHHQHRRNPHGRPTTAPSSTRLCPVRSRLQPRQQRQLNNAQQHP